MLNNKSYNWGIEQRKTKLTKKEAVHPGPPLSLGM
jgi:hypothetical protein